MYTNLRCMKVSEIINKYNPIYPPEGDWDDTVKFMLESDRDRSVVLELQKVLLNEGQFREPILLMEEKEFNFVSDGTHRVVAALLTDTEIELTVGGLNADFYSLSETTVVCNQIHQLERVESDALTDDLRSFKVKSDVWASSGLVTIQEGEVEILWENEIDTEHHSQLHDKLHSIFSSYGLSISSISTR